MRRVILAGAIPGLMLCLAGCGEGDAPTTAAPTTAAPVTLTPGDSPLMKLQSPAETAATTSSGTTSTESGAGTVAATTDAPASVPAAQIKPMDTLEEPAEAISELGIGDAAPPVTIAKWVKGEPVTSFNPEKVHVVEFWATWCGPCLASMPHIAGLQVEYGDKVTFIGVSDEDEPTVTEFMGQTARGSDKTWSDILTYTIALDQNRATNAAYMQAAGQNGIPCAFIVGKSGNVEWIGHPMHIDEPLQQIVDGTWDSEKARVDFIAEKEAEKARMEAGPKIVAAIQSGDFKTAVGHVDELIARFPNDQEFPMIRFQFLLRGEMNEEANKAATALIEANKDEAMQLNQLAWMMTMAQEKPGIDLNIAQSAAQRAVELTEEKDASNIDTLARVLFKMGKTTEAIELQKKAVALAPGEDQIKAALDEYEAAAKAAEAPAAEPPAVDSPTAPAAPPEN